jgi:hypothetical protein
MIDNKLWAPTPGIPTPVPPRGYKPGDGNVDFGLFPYWIKNPSLINDPTVKADVIKFQDILTLYAPSQMTAVNYAKLTTKDKSKIIVYSDGSILNTETYANYDQGWFAAFYNLFQTLRNDNWYNNGEFPMPVPPAAIPISGRTANKVTIAMMGDWGAGNPSAMGVINQIAALTPDYIIHLGDVYYSGTPLASDPKSSFYINAGEEVRNFMALWPKGYAKKSFTLNSNHEMYPGGYGYFLDALRAASSPFSQQNGTSCFALTYGGWTILGLDSAYNGKTSNAFMYGYLDGDKPVQSNWIKQLKPNPAKTIVLTHHTGFAYDTSTPYSLWAEVKAALGSDPYAWYWGHVHNGIVYKSPVNIPVSKYNKKAFKTYTYARCAGHGALPYGYASALTKNTNIEWVEGKEKKIILNGPLQNGFVVLSLSSDSKTGQLTQITEDFYNLGTFKPVFSKTIYGGQKPVSVNQKKRKIKKVKQTRSSVRARKR